MQRNATASLRRTIRPQSRPTSRPFTTTAPPAQTNLQWPEYFGVRKAKRRWELIMTVPFTLAGFFGGATYFGSLELDTTKLVMGVDPLFFYGGLTVACGGVGYLVGPIVGSTCWRLTHRRTMLLIEARDKQFHNRVVKNRVDPSMQSATNPVPDYYGEKIGSLHQYRQWLRDQSKYKKKAELPEE